MIKVGDKVRRKNYDHGTFDIGDLGTVSEVQGLENVRLLEDQTRFPDYSHRIENLELVAENSVARTRTVTEIVPGLYDHVKVNDPLQEPAKDGCAHVSMYGSLSADGLRAAARVLVSLAEALEENAK